ncbi:MAG: hypothetical protein DI586_02540 [Micavibrio aeruginosavorus]|uniref:Uncharacterized protein n=1 Tax=Micavibrio aeruginosavorus TaxID=349221 RepID=A0A2W5FLI6_9BACT|nr:MAG: hypothetical protein DI586_02540 [Micavibrio aeruginosavorus]
MSNFLSLIKYWKSGGVIILIAAFLMSFHLARSRGEKLEKTTHVLETERQKFKTQLIQIEKARQDEKERNDFRKSQNKKLKLAATGIPAFPLRQGFGGQVPGKADRSIDHLRDVYELLRQRQGNTGPE